MALSEKDLRAKVAQLEVENQRLRKVAEKAESERAFAWETLESKDTKKYDRLAARQESAEMLASLWKKKSKKLERRNEELDSEIEYQHGKLWDTLLYFGKIDDEHKETIKEIWEITDDSGWDTEDSDSDTEDSDSEEQE
jgi:hypothetical protein